MDIIHCSVFYSKHNVPETWFSLRPQVEPTKLVQQRQLVPVSGVYLLDQTE
jgi:hypothetical protein